MFRWLSLWLIVCCGCVAPFHDSLGTLGEPLTASDVEWLNQSPGPGLEQPNRKPETTRRAAATRNTNDAAANSAAKPPAERLPRASSKPSLASAASDVEPPDSEASSNSRSGKSSHLAELEQLLTSQTANLSPEHQEYFRRQFQALLAQKEETSDTAVERDSHRYLPASTPVTVAEGSTLPGPDEQVSSYPSESGRLSDDSLNPATVSPRQESTAVDQRVARASVTAANRLQQDVPDPSVAQATANLETAGSTPARAADAPQLVGKESSATQPVDNLKPGQWRDSLATALNDLEKELVRLSHDENEAATLDAYVRLMHVISNHSGESVAAIDKLPEDEREFWKHQLLALLHILDAEHKHAPSRRAALTLRELRSAIDQLANQSTLDIRNLAFCSGVDGYGRYTEFRTHAFRPGQQVLLYVEIDNFVAEPVKEKFETAIQGEYAIVDASGARLIQAELPFMDQLCNNRLRDYFIAYDLFLPKDLRPGQYTLQLTIEDVKGHKSSQASLDFGIR